MYTFIIFAQNKPGVLYRISDLFLRRKINIESLTVAETERKGISRFTVCANMDENSAEKISKQLYRIIEVIKVVSLKDEDLFFKELALVKVFAPNPQKRKEIETLVDLFKAKIDYVGEDFLLIEKVGTEEEIQSMLSLFKPFGIQDFVRSGRIALVKGEKWEGKFLKTLKKPETSLEIPMIKKIQSLILKEKDGISLAQGIPDFPTPLEFKERAIEAMRKNLTDKYSLGYGIEPLREAICEKLKKKNKIECERENIIVTHGAMEGLMATFLALFKPTDEILILTPDYASHLNQVQILKRGQRPVFIPLIETESGWQLDFEKLEASVTPQTKAILICNPSNPLGKVYSFDELKKIAHIALRYNLFIITDEVYEYFVFDQREHISIGSFPEVAERVISIFSLSKTYSMTGWRLGYLVAEKNLANEIFKVHDCLINCPTVVSQYLGLAAIQEGDEKISYFKREYEKRREMAMEILARAKKLKVLKPEGTYYLFPKIELEGMDDYEFSLRLVKEAKVGVVPGSAFGPGGENHVRISFGVNEEKLKEGLERLVKFLEKI